MSKFPVNTLINYKCINPQSHPWANPTWSCQFSPFHKDRGWAIMCAVSVLSLNSHSALAPSLCALLLSSHPSPLLIPTSPSSFLIHPPPPFFFLFSLSPHPSMTPPACLLSALGVLDLRHPEDTSSVIVDLYKKWDNLRLVCGEYSNGDN